MTLWHWPNDRAVLELDAPELELLIYFDPGAGSRACWLDSQSGRVVRWVTVGAA